MEYNLSPETLLWESKEKPIIQNVNLEDLINKKTNLGFLKDLDYAMPATGVCFRKDVEGLFPSLMSSLYSKRKGIKKEMLSIKAEREQVAIELRKRGIDVKDM